MTTYTTDGSVRGKCGHRHRSLWTALQCLQDDRRECRSVGGYSDREVVRCDGEPLSEDEQADLVSWHADLVRAGLVS